MKSILDLSLKVKFPLWGALLIVVTALLVTISLVIQSYSNLKQELDNTTESLSNAVVHSLFTRMLHDDVWGAFELIDSTITKSTSTTVLFPEEVLVVTNQKKIFISSNPAKAPLLTDISELENSYERISDFIPDTYDKNQVRKAIYTDNYFYSISPVHSDGVILGSLVFIYSKQHLYAEFEGVLVSAGIICAVILAILLPISWFWGKKTATPLVELTNSIVSLSNGRLNEKAPTEYAHNDELGKLLQAYLVLIETLREKQSLEENMIRSERLAAVGRLSAGMAHEINNPLGGIMLALNNFRKREEHSPQTLKTLSLIERGLDQIHDTVNAILVDVKIETRFFSGSDMEDIKLLLSSEIKKRQIDLVLHTDSIEEIRLPATQIRQILMNLLMNAIQATDVGGIVVCKLLAHESTLTIVTENEGSHIPPSTLQHLFEPFVSNKPHGHGIGLWVIYQIVTKLGGTIDVDTSHAKTIFIISIPFRDES